MLLYLFARQQSTAGNQPAIYAEPCNLQQFCCIAAKPDAQCKYASMPHWLALAVTHKFDIVKNCKYCQSKLPSLSLQNVALDLRLQLLEAVKKDAVRDSLV